MHARITSYLWTRVVVLLVFMFGAWIWGGWNGAFLAVPIFFVLNWVLAFVIGLRSGWKHDS
jgi:predicted PurR-regulated permease PerM